MDTTPRTGRQLAETLETHKQQRQQQQVDLRLESQLSQQLQVAL